VPRGLRAPADVAQVHVEPTDLFLHRQSRTDLFGELPLRSKDREKMPQCGARRDA
jgi:hypothetical protein